MKTDGLYTIVHIQSLRPVVPFDCNPDSDDEGMLVYGSFEAASKAADHQNGLYDVECIAFRVEALDEGVLVPVRRAA